MLGKKGNTKLSEITKTEKTTEKNGNQKNGQQKNGQPENSATKNDSVGKRETQSYMVSRRDAQFSGSHFFCCPFFRCRYFTH